MYSEAATVDWPGSLVLKVPAPHNQATASEAPRTRKTAQARPTRSNPFKKLGQQKREDGVDLTEQNAKLRQTGMKRGRRNGVWNFTVHPDGRE